MANERLTLSPDNSIVYGQYLNVTAKSGCEERIHHIIEEPFV